MAQMPNAGFVKGTVPYQFCPLHPLPFKTLYSRGGTISNFGSISRSIFFQIKISISISISIVSLPKNQDQDQYQDQYFSWCQYQYQDQYLPKSKININIDINISKYWYWYQKINILEASTCFWTCIFQFDNLICVSTNVIS